jgi:hypothetical protein
MKSRKPLLSTLAAGAFLLAGTLIAQNAPPPSPTGQDMPAAPATSAQPMPSAPTTPAPASTSSQAAQGQVVVRSVPPPAPTIGPAPPFEQLSGGKKWITPEQAVAYPPLANDFIHADTNRDGRISKAEYTNWVKQL